MRETINYDNDKKIYLEVLEQDILNQLSDNDVINFCKHLLEGKEIEHLMVIKLIPTLKEYFCENDIDKKILSLTKDVLQK